MALNALCMMSYPQSHIFKKKTVKFVTLQANITNVEEDPPKIQWKIASSLHKLLKIAEISSLRSFRQLLMIIIVLAIFFNKMIELLTSLNHVTKTKRNKWNININIMKSEYKKNEFNGNYFKIKQSTISAPAPAFSNNLKIIVKNRTFFYVPLDVSILYTFPYQPSVKWSN